MGSAHPNLVPYRAFEANDGWFVIGVGSDNQWQSLVAALDKKETLGLQMKAVLTERGCRSSCI